MSLSKRSAPYWSNPPFLKFFDSMILNTLKCNHLTPLGLKGLNVVHGLYFPNLLPYSAIVVSVVLFRYMIHACIAVSSVLRDYRNEKLIILILLLRYTVGPQKSMRIKRRIKIILSEKRLIVLMPSLNCCCLCFPKCISITMSEPV